MLVFAEVNGDPAYEAVANNRWLPGKLPAQPHTYYDAKLKKKPQGYQSDYFHQASFGAYSVTGSHFPELVQIDQAEAGYHSFDKISNKINAWYNDPRNAGHPFVKQLHEHDRWTMKSSMQPKIMQPDSLFDLVIVVWRVNSKLSKTSNSGYCSSGNATRSLLDRKGTNCHSEFVSHANDAHVVMRHEISHALYGGNNFHTGGAGAGKRTFIPSVGGASNLSSWDHFHPGWNAWDRNRIGWKNPTKKFLVSAYQINNAVAEKSFDDSLMYERLGGMYALRDFNPTGDAIRLPLPGPDSPRLKQYLWLEFHADSGRFDIQSPTRRGVFAFVQVGKDDKTKSFNDSNASPGNYTFPLPASGRWDFEYGVDSVAGKTFVRRDPSKPNPVSGNHYLIRPIQDNNANGKLDDGMMLPEILYDGDNPPVQRHVTFGNDDDAFKAETQTTLGVSTNPSTNTLITYSFPGHRVNPFDSDTSFVTGLRIEMRDTVLQIEKKKQNVALAKIEWNRYDITNNVRWCGTIGLKPVDATPNLTVENNSTLLLDRSLTPMLERVNETDTLDGQLYFSPLTTFTLYPGTQLTVKKGSTLRIVNGSKLYVHKGAKLVVENGATVDAADDAIVYL